jgi:hypothetical protein
MFVSAIKRPDRYPGQDDYDRLEREVRDAHELYTRRGYLVNPAELHRPPPPVTAPHIDRKWYPRLAYERVRFDSGYAPEAGDAAGERWQAYEANRTGYAHVVRHSDPNRPWLICVHGLGTGSPWLDFPGFRARRLHRKLGFNLVFPVMPLHGARREPGSQRGALLSFELLENLHGLTQAVWDTRRLIRWAREQGASRIGIFGLSVGAYVGSIVSALEPIDLVIAGIPLCDVPDLFSTHGGDDVRETAALHHVLDERVRALYDMVSPLAVEPSCAPSRRFIFGGMTDGIVTPTHAERLWHWWGQPSMHWYHGGHVSFFWSRETHRFVDAALATLSEES